MKVFFCKCERRTGCFSLLEFALRNFCLNSKRIQRKFKRIGELVNALYPQRSSELPRAFDINYSVDHIQEIFKG